MNLDRADSSSDQRKSTTAASFKTIGSSLNSGSDSALIENTDNNRLNKELSNFKMSKSSSNGMSRVTSKFSTSNVKGTYTYRCWYSQSMYT